MILSRLLLLVPALFLSAVATPVPEAADSNTAVSAAGPRSLDKRSFLETCLGASDPLLFTLSSGHILNGACRNTAGGWNFHTTDLNLCITNNNGRLQWMSSGAYSLSCPNRGLRHTYYDIDQAINQVYLWADCYNGSGALVRSEITLNDRMHNFNGWMVCLP